MLPAWTKQLALALGLAALIPLALIANARVSTSTEPRIHIVHDMDHQEKFRPQAVNDMFADGRAMRLPVEGTVARGELAADDHLYRGIKDGAWATTYPAQLEVDAAFVERGRQRYEIFCAVCHGHSGYGDGMVHYRAMQLVAANTPGMAWATPPNYHDDTIKAKPNGHYFNVISNGFNNMQGYAAQVSVEDRWAIVAYVRAIQLAAPPNSAKENR